MGLLEATANDYDRIQHSNKVVEFSWWLAAVALTARPKLVKIALFFTEDCGGDQEAGPTSIWALEGFRSLQGVGEARRGAAFFCRFAGAEQRRPMGVLTNVAALDQFFVLRLARLPNAARKACVSRPSSQVMFLWISASAYDRFHGNRFQFWRCASSYASILAAYFPSALAGLWSRGPKGWVRCIFHESFDGEFVVAVRSSSSVGSFPESLGSLCRACVDKKLTRSLLRDFAGTEGIDNFVGWDTFQLAALDSWSPITTVCSTWPTSRFVSVFFISCGQGSCEYGGSFVAYQVAVAQSFGNAPGPFRAEG